MSHFWRQVIAMVCLIALPLCVTAITAVGLWRLDHLLKNVSEEYSEARLLQGIDRDLNAAAMGLGSGDAELIRAARGSLRSAETALVGYLATQFESVASEEHQAIEAGRASTLLRELQRLLSDEAGFAEPGARAADIHRLRGELTDLLNEEDEAVQIAHESARVARASTLSLVIITSLVSTLLCAALLIWSNHGVNQRLRELHQRLASQSPGTPARTAKGMGEVVTQIEDINAQMLRKIEEHGRELLRRERMVGIGLLAADVAHEINNPMNAMLGLTELGLRTIERGPLDGEATAELGESLRVVRREALRCKGIVERLMAMVRSDRRPSWFDATRLVHETVQVARAARPDRDSCFVVTGDGVSVRAYGPANEVRQILLTLLINAADAVSADGRIEVDATATDQEVWLRVRDNGRGFTEEVRRTFFTPFQSFSENGTGAGLGLSIAQALAEGMGATLTPFSDGPGQGSLFILAIKTPEEQA
jgi:signal transduction histidine kinase